MGHTQQQNLRNKQRSIRTFSRFQPTTIALLLSLGMAGCATTDKQVKAYQPAETAAVVPRTAAATPVAVITAEPSEGAEIQIRADSPQEYVVQKGDTLWDISGEFLHDPYQWPNVWKQNPSIKNPHLIYPGDMVRLSVIDGRAVIDVLRPDEQGVYSSISGTQSAGKKMRNGREVLSPKVHEEELVHSVSNGAAEAIRDFTQSPHVMANDELKYAAYVLGSSDGRLASANGDRVFARGFQGHMQEDYSVYRPSKPLIDPETGAVLGYEAKRVADATVVESGDPVTMRLHNSTQETSKGDRLVPRIDEALDNPVPKAVHPSISAQVISLYDSLARAAQHQVVVLNKGTNNGIETGSMLEISTSNDTIFDDLANNGEGEYVQLPDQVKGNAIVFRSFDNVSYALILQATLPVKIGDNLRGF